MNEAKISWRGLSAVILAAIGLVAMGGDSIEPVSTGRSIITAICVSIALILALDIDVLFFSLLGRFSRFMDDNSSRLTIKIKK